MQGYFWHILLNGLLSVSVFVLVFFLFPHSFSFLSSSLSYLPGFLSVEPCIQALVGYSYTCGTNTRCLAAPWSHVAYKNSLATEDHSNSSVFVSEDVS